MNELDKLQLRIAELQGYKKMFGRMDKASILPHEYFIRPDGRPTLYPPDYPREALAALELLSDAMAEGAQIDIVMKPGHCHVTIGFAAQRKFYSAFGFDLSEASARAWIAWKESEVRK